VLAIGCAALPASTDIGTGVGPSAPAALLGVVDVAVCVLAFQNVRRSLHAFSG
jgi:hypothetical protein